MFKGGVYLQLVIMLHILRNKLQNKTYNIFQNLSFYSYRQFNDMKYIYFDVPPFPHVHGLACPFFYTSVSNATDVEILIHI